MPPVPSVLRPPVRLEEAAPRPVTVTPLPVVGGCPPARKHHGSSGYLTSASELGPAPPWDGMDAGSGGPEMRWFLILGGESG